MTKLRLHIILGLVVLDLLVICSCVSYLVGYDDGWDSRGTQYPTWVEEQYGPTLK